MAKLLTAFIILLCAAVPVFAQPAPSPDALKDLAPTGKLRAAINFGNGVLAQKGPNDEPRGVSAELASALAKRLGVPVEFVIYTAAGKVFAGAKDNAWDIGFIAIEPVRAAEVDFSPPYVIIQGAYLVRKDSPLKDVADVDSAGNKDRRWPWLGLRSLPHPHAEERDIGACAAGRGGRRHRAIYRPTSSTPRPACANRLTLMPRTIRRCG